MIVTDASTSTLLRDRRCLDIYRSRLPELKERGKDVYAARCRFHDDNGPSLSVGYKDGWVWFCHGACKRGGGLLDFIMTTDNVDKSKAFDILRECLGETRRHRTSLVLVLKRRNKDSPHREGCGV